MKPLPSPPRPHRTKQSFKARTCVGCGAARTKSSLHRLVVHDGKVVLDLRKRLPGRGAYLCGQGCLRSAMKRKVFQRAFRNQVCSLNVEVIEALLPIAAQQLVQ